MGNFGKNLLSGISSGLGSGIVGMGLNLLGQGFNALFGGKSEEEKQKELMDYQNKLELERMGLQAEYNKEMADYNQANAKDMYDYTFDKQAKFDDIGKTVENLKKNNLNVGLMYGGGSPGGSSVSASSAGGQAGAVSALQPMSLQIAIQKKQLDMQEKLNDAQVTKTYAEAAKIAGADIENVKANTENLRETKNQIKASIENIQEKTKLDKFQNWINNIKKNAKDHDGTTFEEFFIANLFSEMEKEDARFDAETSEYINRADIARKLFKDLDKIAKGNVAASEKNMTDKERADFELRQEKALEDIINDIGGDGKYGRLLSKILAFFAAKW